MTSLYKNNYYSIVKELVFVISSFSTYVYRVISSNNADKDRVSNLFDGLFLTFLGFLFFVNFTTLLNRLILCTPLGLKFAMRYDLSLSECIEISNKLVSALQSVFSCICGFFICSYSCRRNFLTTTTFLSESYAWFGSAYFYYDIFSMYRVHNAKLLDKLNLKTIDWTQTGDFYGMIPSLKRELSLLTPIIINNEKLPSFWQYIKITKLMVFHHMFIGSYGLIVISSWRGGLGDCIFSFLFLMEFSTPFVSFRAILSILKLKHSGYYFWNGIIMLASFLIFRIVMLPSLLYYYAVVINSTFITAILNLPIGCQLSIIALFVPQFYWFNLMVKAAFRTVKTLKEQRTLEKVD